MVLPAAEVKTAGLLSVLDEDTRHLESTLAKLDALRSLLIKREEAALEQLLDDIRRQADAYQGNEQKRQQFRRDLAADLGCAPSDLTLSRLQRALTGPSRTAVADRQARLRALAAQLKREYTLTVLLLRDCSRFNRALLAAFFGTGGRGGATYSPTGVAKHGTSVTFMSTQL